MYMGIFYFCVLELNALKNLVNKLSVEVANLRKENTTVVVAPIEKKPQPAPAKKQTDDDDDDGVDLFGSDSEVNSIYLIYSLFWM